MSKNKRLQKNASPGNAESAKLELGDPGEENASPGNAEPQLGFSAQGAKLELGDPGWYSRGYLPHRDELHLFQSITFRQADSLPQKKLRELEIELKRLPENQRSLQRRKQIEAWLDSGMGSCALANPRVAQMTQETLLYHQGERYDLRAWCIMPNHVHVLMKPKCKLASILQSWKSYSGRWVMEQNTKLGLSIPSGKFWMREYWDRYIRSEEHFQNVITYIHQNPVKAGLCRKPEDWPWSSASPGNAEPQLGFSD